MVLLDAGVIHLPVANLPQPDVPAKVNKAEQSQQAVPVRPKTVSPVVSHDKPTQKKPVKHHAEESPQPVTEPVICDQSKARAVRKKAQEIAVITEQGGVLSVTLGKDWAYYSPGIKRSFVERFVASDTCLRGSPRSIIFYFRGEQVASTDIHGGIEFK